MGILDSSIIEQIQIKSIHPSNLDPRTKFYSNDVEQLGLARSIREHGLIQPILVRPVSHGFEIVSGHRRFYACKLLRHRFIPSKICDLTNKESFEIQLTENIQRKSLNVMEEAIAFRRYVNEFGWGGAQSLAKKIGKSQEYVSHRMQLLDLSNEVKEQLVNHNLKLSHGIELVTIPKDFQDLLMNDILNENLTVKQVRDIKSNLSVKQSKNMKHIVDSIKITKKAILCLKVTLNRIDSLIEEVQTVVSPEKKSDLVCFLMDLRLTIHRMIDHTIKFKKTELM